MYAINMIYKDNIHKLLAIMEQLFSVVIIKSIEYKGSFTKFIAWHS